MDIGYQRGIQGSDLAKHPPSANAASRALG
jgi:hypothetical protein